jgi:predicted metalloprotease with PDZ domain
VRSDLWKAYEDKHKWTDLSYSIGFQVKEDGTIADVQFGGPAQKAGVAPAVKVIAVDGRQFTPTVVREAVAAQKPVELLVKDGEYYKTYRVDYTGGERYPHLVRDSASADLLTGIISAKVKK